MQSTTFFMLCASESDLMLEPFLVLAEVVDQTSIKRNATIKLLKQHPKDKRTYHVDTGF